MSLTSNLQERERERETERQRDRQTDRQRGFITLFLISTCTWKNLKLLKSKLSCPLIDFPIYEKEPEHAQTQMTDILANMQHKSDVLQHKMTRKVFIAQSYFTHL